MLSGLIIKMSDFYGLIRKQLRLCHLFRPCDDLVLGLLDVRMRINVSKLICIKNRDCTATQTTKAAEIDCLYAIARSKFDIKQTAERGAILLLLRYRPCLRLPVH